MKTLNKSIIVAERLYHPVLFRFKNQNPELDVKIITPDELLDMATFSFSSDPIPFLVYEKRIEYCKAKKWVNLIRKTDVTKNQKLFDLYESIKNQYLSENEYGKYELSLYSVFLFELDEDKELQECIKRAGYSFELLHFEDLLIEEEKTFKTPNILQFPNKIVQFQYIFADIRKKLLENKDLADKIKILIDSDTDLFFVNLYSKLFDVPVFITVSHSLNTFTEVTDILKHIYSTKSFDLSEVNDENNKKEIVSAIISTYKLNELPFEYAYANLLEILKSLSENDALNDRGILVTCDFNFTLDSIVYVTNFQYGSFYQAATDNNVLSDSELLEVNGNPSYTKTALDRRKKLNYLKHTNIVLLSRVEQHLSDSIYDSQFIQEIGWKNYIKKYSIVKDGTFTDKAAQLVLCNQLDKKYFTKEYKGCNSYDHTFKGISGKQYVNPRKWSITNLESYINCPYKYYLSKIIPTMDEDRHAMCRGILIHAVYEKMYYSDFNFDECFEKGKLEYIEKFQEKGDIYGEKEDVYVEIIRYWLKQMVEICRKINDHMNRVSPSEGRSDFERQIDFVIRDEIDNEYWFTGRIDKILVTENNGRTFYTIIDYKTGAEKFDASTVCLGISIQLPLYYYAIENSLQPSIYTNGGEFGGFGIQTVYFSSIKTAYKVNNGYYLSNDALIANTKISGLFLESLDYINSIDNKADKNKSGTVNSQFLQTKDRLFSEVDADNCFVKSKTMKLERYNVNDIVDDAIKAVIRIIKHIKNNDFPIKPTSLDVAKFDETKLSCGNCAYKDVCYHNSKDAYDYSKAISRRFDADPNWDKNI